jgi:DNA-binding NtrC family response regulator
MDPSKRILIVDDEPNVRLVFRTALELAGHVVAEASDGEAALARLRATPVALVLLDLKMPGVDGMETLRRLRAAGDDTAVVIVTAQGSIPDTVAAMRLGAIDFIPKPVSPATLREVVAGALARRASDPPWPRIASSTVSSEATLFAEDLARTRRAMDQREFDDAEFFLRIADTLDPGSAEVVRLRDDLRARRATPEGLTYRVVGKLLS